MQASDIIKGLQDLISIIQNDQHTTKFQEPTTVAKHEVVATVEPSNALAGMEDEKFVPPLQAKIELLKKATGVASTYDGDGEQDELSRITQMAGIKKPHAVVQDMAGEDEPLDA